MKKIILTIVACLGMITASAQGENKVEIANVNYEKGVEGSFDIMVQTKENLYNGFQTFMYLPTEIVLPTEDGSLLPDVIFSNKITRATSFDILLVTNPDIPTKPGYTCYLVVATLKGKAWTTTEQVRLCSVNYDASNVDKLSIYLTQNAFGPLETSDAVLKLEDAEYTGITGIAADKAEVANDGKFVENNRVVIKKAGVKYSTTGQVIK